MAIINSYPKITPTTDDLILGTDTSSTPNSTKSFSIGDVIGLAPQIGYKTYVAQITQSGTNAPVATVLQNNTELTFTWTYNAPGAYQVGASSPFVANKTWVQVSGSNTTPSAHIIILKSITTSAITFHNLELKNAAQVNGIDVAFVEIRIYP